MTKRLSDQKMYTAEHQTRHQALKERLAVAFVQGQNFDVGSRPLPSAKPIADWCHDLAQYLVEDAPHEY